MICPKCHFEWKEGEYTPEEERRKNWHSCSENEVFDQRRMEAVCTVCGRVRDMTAG